jgi:hypothetical protein
MVVSVPSPLLPKTTLAREMDGTTGTTITIARRKASTTAEIRTGPEIKIVPGTNPGLTTDDPKCRTGRRHRGILRCRVDQVHTNARRCRIGPVHK